MKRLNLGSGAFPKAGSVNVDLFAEDGADVVHDLSRFPYPLVDDEFDVVEGGHCLEHLPDPFLEDLRLRWFAQPYLKKTVLSRRAFRAASAAGRALNAVANASPELCSRLWCNWVGGFEEIEFRVAVVKRA